MTYREQEYNSLKAWIELSETETENENKLIKIATVLLDYNSSETDPKRDCILEFVRDSFPSPNKYFNKSFWKRYWNSTRLIS